MPLYDTRITYKWKQHKYHISRTLYLHKTEFKHSITKTIFNIH